MPRIIIHHVRATVSAHSLAQTVQQYTGLPLPEAQRVVDRARAGERVAIEMDDEYAAYDLASVLSDLGATAEVDESM
jgi:ribosomal protein L7/L12